MCAHYRLEELIIIKLYVYMNEKLNPAQSSSTSQPHHLNRAAFHFENLYKGSAKPCVSTERPNLLHRSINQKLVAAASSKVLGPRNTHKRGNDDDFFRLLFGEPIASGCRRRHVVDPSCFEAQFASGAAYFSRAGSGLQSPDVAL